MKILKSWEFWLMVALYFVTVYIMGYIESIAPYKDSLLPLFGLLPFVAIWYIIFVKPTIKK